MKTLRFIFLFATLFLFLQAGSFAQKLPNIHILATGGTIAGTGTSTTGSSYRAGQVAINELISAVPELKEIANITGEQIVKIVLGAVVSTDWGVLKAVKGLLLLVKSPTDEYRQRLEESLCDSDDFLSDAAKKQLEKANKRSVKRKESKLINMIFDCIISLMHDVMMILTNDSRRVVNSDFFEELKSFANKTNQIKMVQALDQVISLKNANTYNVSSESLLDLALFEFKGAQE